MYVIAKWFFKTLPLICLALRAFPISVALLWTLSNSLMVFLLQCIPNCTECLRWGHASAWGGDKGLLERVYVDNCCPTLSPTLASWHPAILKPHCCGTVHKLGATAWAPSSPGSPGSSRKCEQCKQVGNPRCLWGHALHLQHPTNVNWHKGKDFLWCNWKQIRSVQIQWVLEAC